ncbi:regulatory protein GemA [Nitratireductor soli]|uniref:regulatory protein GemA n=1 Tax=Nitratireductor soli TaxID=1670619 RepID=UPI000A94778A|nr:regulatory protein GemA [Nitratireductor soli]
MSAYAAIHVGLKQVGIEGEDKRDFYMRLTGKPTLTVMTSADHGAVLQELRRLGFKQHSKGSRPRLEGRYAKKLQALWIAAWNLGLVRSRDDKALLAFVKRQTGIDHVRFLRHPEDAAKAIEALKAWMTRGAGVEWRAPLGTPGWMARPAYRLALAQWAILEKADTLPQPGSLATFVRATTGAPDPAAMTDAQWREVMNALGKRVREAAT